MSEVNAAVEYPEIFADLAEKVAKLLVQRGIQNDQAHEIGREAADMMRQDWGGLQLYFPKGRSYTLSRRDFEIWKEWDGRNVDYLCRKYNLSRVRLYQIIAAFREQETERRQGKLF